MPVAIPKNRVSIPHPMVDCPPPRPCLGAAYDHLRRASIDRGVHTTKGNMFANVSPRRVRIHACRACPPLYPPAPHAQPITVSCPRAALVPHFLILIRSRRPPRCRRAEANSPTWSDQRDGRAMFDLVITLWYPTGGRIALPRVVRRDWLGRGGRQPLLFHVDSATTRSSPIFGKPTQVITARGSGSSTLASACDCSNRRLFVYARRPSESLLSRKRQS